MKLKAWFLIFLFGLGWLNARHAFAAERNWTGTTNSTWPEAGKWEPAAASGPESIIAIDTNIINQPVIGSTRPVETHNRIKAAGIKWIKVAGGKFLMGSDTGYYDAKPAHDIRVKAFLIAETEVTFGQYKACMAAGACSMPHIKDSKCFVWTGTQWAFGELPDFFQTDSQPVVCVDWFQARQFAEWAGGRLPSEAQWEFAARSGGKNTRYPWGDEDASCKIAVMDDGVNGCGMNRTWPVCSMPAGKTQQGVCDMIGNVWEWCEDAYYNSYEGAPADGNARLPLARFGRVKRGSCWRNREPWVMKATDRGRLSPYESDALTGFRPVKELP